MFNLLFILFNIYCRKALQLYDEDTFLYYDTEHGKELKIIKKLQEAMLKRGHPSDSSVSSGIFSPESSGCSDSSVTFSSILSSESSQSEGNEIQFEIDGNIRKVSDKQVRKDFLNILWGIWLNHGYKINHLNPVSVSVRSKSQLTYHRVVKIISQKFCDFFKITGKCFTTDLGEIFQVLSGEGIF